MDRSILWRRLDQPGHESARLTTRGFLWQLDGTSVFSHEQKPCRLDYHIICNADWKTRTVHVAGWIGSEAIEVDLAVDGGGRWQRNGRECPEVSGCLDIDLNFSPSTNLLPIRRLDLAIGEEGRVRAACPLPELRARAAPTDVSPNRRELLPIRERRRSVHARSHRERHRARHALPELLSG